jgi:Leucine-rich repeat (LRR) protein
LENLEELELADLNLTEIGFISNLKKLTMLDLDNNNISDLSPLDELPKLKNLSLEETPKKKVNR